MAEKPGHKNCQSTEIIKQTWFFDIHIQMKYAPLLVFTLFGLLNIRILAQTSPLPTIRVTGNTVTMYLNGERDSFNGISSFPNPFSYDWGMQKDSMALSLVSEKDSIAMLLQYGKVIDFRIIREDKKDTVICHFTTHKLVKAAVFTETYKKATQGKTIIESPEVYELINVIFALTDYGKTEAIHKEEPYYKAVISYFTPHKNHPAVRVLDSLLKDESQYAPLKMDSYAYVFNGNIVHKSTVYDRVSWGEYNTLTPYVPLLEQFARQSNFRAFYRRYLPYYAGLIADFEKNVDVVTMKKWLEKQFPTTQYSAVKIIFSPLVGFNQSANSFSDNDFTEAQCHINFPFVDAEDRKQSVPMLKGQRMKIVFTELNHSYLNPEAEKYQNEVSAAFNKLSNWQTPNTPSTSYNSSLSCFEEYMNYALVTLLYHDIFDSKTFDTLRAGIDKNMTNRRGFSRFAAFDQELLILYRNRKTGQTVADLYPAILAWAKNQ